MQFDMVDFDLFFQMPVRTLRCGLASPPLLKLDRHHRAYELSMDLRFCEFKEIETGSERFKFGAADCEAIKKELGSPVWYGFSLVRVWISLLACFMLLYGRALVVLYRRPRRIVSKSFRGSRRS
jgi:hypothetical protein